MLSKILSDSANEKIQNEKSQNEFIEELERTTQYINDDMTFPKAEIDPNLARLQDLVVEFVTAVILKHENEIYQLVSNHFPNKKEYLLLTTNASIIEMITNITNKFYNNIYNLCQSNTPPEQISLMLNYADYGAHILLDKLIRLTLEIHLDIWRESLIDVSNYDIYEKSVCTEINIVFQSLNLLHILSKGIDDNSEFVNLEPGQVAFDIVIDKNIST